MGEVERKPHDGFFKGAFGLPEVCRDFLEHYLPGPLSGQLDLNCLELEKESFVEPEDLRRRYGDLLYRTRLKGSAEAFVYILFDHKSSTDPDALLQLLGYMLAIWRRELQIRREKGFPVYPLPPILPVLFHHGERGWSHPVCFEDLVGEQELFAQFTPHFSCHLFDLTLIPDEVLRGGVMLLATLLLLRHAHEARLAPFVEVFSENSPPCLTNPMESVCLRCWWPIFRSWAMTLIRR